MIFIVIGRYESFGFLGMVFWDKMFDFQKIETNLIDFYRKNHIGFYGYWGHFTVILRWDPLKV